MSWWTRSGIVSEPVQPLDLLALALAAWMRRVRGEDEQGAPIEVRHPLAEQLRVKAIEGGPDPRPLLGMVQLFGDTGTDPRLVEPVGRWLTSLYAQRQSRNSRLGVTSARVLSA